MKRPLIMLITVLLLVAFAFASNSPPTLRWLGHSCFLITSPQGKRLLIDPFSRLGYPPPAVEADVVLVTHEHFDHNNVGVVRGNPVVIRGLKSGAQDWNKVDRTVAGFKIKSFPCYHDTKKGALYGKNSIFLIEVDGLRLAHLGDLGHILPDDTVRAMGKVDVLMIPVGGHFTIGPKKAWRVVSQLEPKVVIPMHFRTSKVNLPIGPVSDFTAGHESVIKTFTMQTAPLVMPKTLKIWLFPIP